ncbi:ammonium transporter [Nocardia puris]|uniref:ammonium transporter n=1 Tax=Nocardia puris TaxID=208602 RepID=UPI000830691E|nr:ammonium transporter [Nocardia puris]MBF6214345.1 ammonium transporter [Nocardia puris]MBF6368960.1 ammonium transporter [Nocardia puris]MBF6462892.1 ammonium transporter [Nocardia puris]
MAAPEIGVPDTGDTAWLLTSAALVLLMTPGLAFFYGGMVRSKNVLNMIMMSISAMGVVAVLWVLYGYSVAFGTDKGSLIGDPTEFFGLRTLLAGFGEESVGVPLVGTIPATVFVAFQAMFAIITVALISGAVADRLKFGSWLVFAGIWATLVYFPVAHWVWGGGWIMSKVEAIDFAGGTAVHINSGAAALALAIVVGKRAGWPKTPFRPHNLPFVMLGAALLWFGWFGFNAGSAVAADGVAGFTFVTTLVATAAAMLAWLLVEKIRDGKPTSLGAASGIVAGLVAITPSCSSVNVLGALIIGVIAGAVCALAVGLKFKFGYDDSLDVVGIHLVGGVLGTVLIGLVAAPEAPAGAEGLFYGGGLELLGRQALGAVAVLAYSFVVALAIAYVIKLTIGLRASEEEESVGMDESEHAETAYDFAAVGGTARSAVKEA